MCLECDGYSHEAAMQALDLQIRVHGWALIQVEDGGADWCYTIGLVERFGHPELCVIDAELDVGAKLIHQLVKGIVARGELPAEHRLTGLQCVEVHRDHLRSHLFARWTEQYGHPLRQGEMAQVVLPAGSYCECHAPLVRRLDIPGPTPSGPCRPNREERRRRPRRGHAA